MENRRRGHGLRAIWNIALGIIALIAIVQELGKPKDKRTWHGKVANFVPYDFRMPTIERIRETYWNPGGPMLSGKVFGVGWAPNFGVLARAKADSDT